MTTNKSVFITCPGCSRQVKVDPLVLAEKSSYKCQFCAVEIASSSEKVASIEMDQKKGGAGGIRDGYVYGEYSKKKRVKSFFLSCVILAALIVAVIFLGVGKINGTYILGVKKRPGLENTYVSSRQTSVSGQYIVDRKIGRTFSYVVVRYSRETGFILFKEI